MRHPTEGVLRRVLDEPAGVSDADREHVAGCPECLGGLASMREDAALVDAALATESVTDVKVDAAWRRLSMAAPAAAASSWAAASRDRHTGQPAACSRSASATPAGSSRSRRSVPSVG